jgi:hypothetical protein
VIDLFDLKRCGMNLGRTLRWTGSGSLLLAIAFAAAGCGASREMPAKQFARVHKPTDRGPTVYAPDVEQAQYNMQALEGLPIGVQASFGREHPGAAITRVEQIPTGTGLMLYRIAYLDDGVAGATTYRASGSDMAPPPAIIIRGDDFGRPRARYAPSTQPALQTHLEVISPNTVR